MNNMLNFLYNHGFYLAPDGAGGGAGGEGDAADAANDEADANVDDGSADENKDENKDDDKEPTVEELKTSISRLEKAGRQSSREAKESRIKLKQYEKNAEDARNKELSDLEKSNEERDNALEEVETLRGEQAKNAIKAVITTEAQKLGFASPSIASRLISVEPNEDAKELKADVIEALTELLADSPELKARKKKKKEGDGDDNPENKEAREKTIRNRFGIPKY